MYQRGAWPDAAYISINSREGPPSMLIELDVFGTLTAASLVLLAGRKLVASWSVLNTYSIPEPVVGGLAVALLMWLLHATATTGSGML